MCTFSRGIQKTDWGMLGEKRMLLPWDYLPIHRRTTCGQPAIFPRSVCLYGRPRIQAKHRLSGCSHPVLGTLCEWCALHVGWFRFLPSDTPHSTQFISTPPSVHSGSGWTHHHFLSLTITLTDDSTHLILRFAIYREPSYIDITIHDSTHKFSAYHTMIHRLASIPVNTHNYNKEILTIQSIA